jgi:hypothetical protein
MPFVAAALQYLQPPNVKSNERYFRHIQSFPFARQKRSVDPEGFRVAVAFIF